MRSRAVLRRPKEAASHEERRGQRRWKQRSPANDTPLQPDHAGGGGRGPDFGSFRLPEPGESPGGEWDRAISTLRAGFAIPIPRRLAERQPWQMPIPRLWAHARGFETENPPNYFAPPDLVTALPRKIVAAAERGRDICEFGPARGLVGGRQTGVARQVVLFEGTIPRRRARSRRLKYQSPGAREALRRVCTPARNQIGRANESATQMPRLGPRARAEIGASVLAAAAATGAAGADESLARFAAVHERYAKAQERVAQRERQLAAAQQELQRRCDVLWRQTLHLIVALVMVGQPRMQPFRRLGAPSPSVLQRLAAAKRAASVLKLAAAARRMYARSETVVEAAEGAALAAAAVQDGILSLRAPEAALSDARAARDAIGRQWDLRLGSLRHAAAAADYVESPGLHRALFRAANRHPSMDRRKRPAKKG